MIKISLMTTNNQISITLTPGLRLEQALKEAGVKEPKTVSNLTITGMLTYDDFRFIRENMQETLQELDMSNASIKEENCSKSLTKIRNFAFAGCIGLKSVIIPNTIIEIAYAVFSGCTGLRSITIPESVTKIGFRTFSGCTGLTTVNIQTKDSVEKIKIESVSDAYQDFTQFIIEVAKAHGKDFSQWYTEEADRIEKLEKHGGGIADCFYNDTDIEAFIPDEDDENYFRPTDRSQPKKFSELTEYEQNLFKMFMQN